MFLAMMNALAGLASNNTVLAETSHSSKSIRRQRFAVRQFATVFD